PAAACQRRQALAKGRVEPLDVGGVDHPVPVRATPERLDPCGCSINDATLDVDNPPLLIPLDDLGDADVAPGTQPGTPVGSRADRVAKGLANRADVGAQAISTEQQGAREGTKTHALDQATNQRHITALAHLAREPQA